MADNVDKNNADLNIKDKISDKAGATKRASNFLEGQLESLRQQVETAEAAVAQYRANHGLFDLGQNRSVTTEELTRLNQQLAPTRAEQATPQAPLSPANPPLPKGTNSAQLGPERKSAGTGH